MGIYVTKFIIGELRSLSISASQTGNRYMDCSYYTSTIESHGFMVACFTSTYNRSQVMHARYSKLPTIVLVLS